MAVRIQDGGLKSIKTSQKHTFAYNCLKFYSNIIQRLININTHNALKIFNIAAKIQDGGQEKNENEKLSKAHLCIYLFEIWQIRGSDIVLCK